MKVLNSFLAITATLLFAGGTVANADASSNSDSTIKNIHSGQAYDSDTSTTNAPSQGTKEIKVENPFLRMTLHPGGGTFNFGVHGLIKYSQFAEFKINRTHKVRAMMNKKSVSSSWKSSGKWAKAETKSYWKYSSNNSYYDYK